MWKVSRLELRLVRELRDWIEVKVKRKLERIGRFFDRLTSEDQLAHLRWESSIADQMDSFSIGCPLAREYLATEEGMAYFGRLMLTEHHPDISEDQAFAVWMELAESGRSDQVLADAQGRLPGQGKVGAPEAS